MIIEMRAGILAALFCRAETWSIDMNDPGRSKRQILAVIGLVCVALSIAMTFLAPGTFWNYGLLLIALVFLFLSRRAA